MADVQLEHGYTRIANEILEAVMQTNLSPTQYKLIIAIFRFTYGFGRKEAEMSLSFLANITLCDKRHIQRELKELESYGIIHQKMVKGKKRFILFEKNFDSWTGKAHIVHLDNVQKDNVQTTNNNIVRLDNTNVVRLDNQERKVKKTINKDMPEASAPDSPTAIELILNDKTLFSISEAKTKEWAVLYPAVDIKQELRKMKGWLDANPAKRKTKRGILRFVNSWLAREQDKGPRQIASNNSDSWGGIQTL